ncbi:MAG: Transcription elongation factor GreA [Candidatus Moranbacteria bacterium GW2011_GWD2_36_12]|nr:MAG: Transcription elongation factor GreA [Candidatus Moranbacteria bacterium GW2011_GWD2_36_12]
MVRFITKEGLKKLNEELEDRKTRLRQEIAQAIKEAKEQGDLSENVPKQNHNKMKMNHALENLKWLSKILKLLKEMILRKVLR